MHVLVTRPETDAAELKAALEALGHEVTVEPLLAIESTPIEPSVFEGACGVIVTSRNGLRALAGGRGARAGGKAPDLRGGSGDRGSSRVNWDFSKSLPVRARRAISFRSSLNSKIGEKPAHSCTLPARRSPSI